MFTHRAEPLVSAMYVLEELGVIQPETWKIDLEGLVNALFCIVNISVASRSRYYVVVQSHKINLNIA